MGHLTPSPKPEFGKSPKNSVRARKEKFKNNFENKDVKSITKERTKNSRSRKTTEKQNTERKHQNERIENKSPEKEKPLSEDDKFSIIMKEMCAGFSSVSNKIEESNTNIDIIKGRLKMMEKVNKKTENENNKKFEEIRKEIRQNTERIEN